MKTLGSGDFKRRQSVSLGLQWDRWGPRLQDTYGNRQDSGASSSWGRRSHERFHRIEKMDPIPTAFESREAHSLSNGGR